MSNVEQHGVKRKCPSSQSERQQQSHTSHIYERNIPRQLCLYYGTAVTKAVFHTLGHDINRVPGLCTVTFV